MFLYHLIYTNNVHFRVDVCELILNDKVVQ